MVYLFLAPGFEEAEALVPLDLLRRAGVEVKAVGVGGSRIAGAHGIEISCERTIEACADGGLEMIVLPGGMPGTRNLEADERVQHFITLAFERELYVGAICAAPSILGHRGLLRGKRVTCFPGFEGDCEGADVTGGFLERDHKLVTAKGMGVALDFGLALVECLKGRGEAEKLKAAVMSR
ncbi:MULTISPECIES: DJ-1 family glyoxalase III [Oscillospiraceae]|uniref:4-methyl-5(B-hydroxyethyl)-thiazole monophosphate biosynthesis n=1 Tax=Harryflintia acetispora TaxID=1849041 RepID=A0A9X8Y7T5_9FIRM|nr:MULTISPECIES: DJ-1 family glyoxalase III [Oscillospiraceae]RGB65139.1 DJ-1 family protein [Harryflintia acetispora]TCL42797.1 4-methyl-5(b-hydroxyethyl)-thiazole monophosphate biosynthesis [Harryflintia acetispora]